MDFTAQSSLEEELMMYAEGVTEPQTWIPPEERSDQKKCFELEKSSEFK